MDGIFFGTYPLSEADVHPTSAIPFFKEAYRMLKKGGVFTYFSCEVDDFSPYHLEMLQAAGFEDIQKKVFPMNTPENCWYWSSDTMVVPIIRK